MLKIPVKGCKPPIDGALDITMLDRIVMHMVGMPLSIQIIPDQMLLQSPLPDAPLALLASAFANPLAAGYRREQCALIRRQRIG
jgi:hypothetical protein